MRNIQYYKEAGVNNYNKSYLSGPFLSLKLLKNIEIDMVDNDDEVAFYILEWFNILIQDGL